MFVSEMGWRSACATLLTVAIGLIGCTSSSATDGSAIGSDAGSDNDGRAGDVSMDAGNCVPCMAHIGPLMNRDKCTQVKDPAPGAIQGAEVDMQVTAEPDGTCLLDAITLLCGGTGTFADGTPLTWSIANGVVTFQDNTRIFTCVVE
jgi:hypothetical protein